MNFDRVAAIYDATRGFPPGVDDRVAEGILAATGAEAGTRFLELGVGTGRIALPLARHGLAYTGVDISQDMMGRLREKAAAESVEVTLIEGDITRLPFPDNSFDACVLVHILHLVPEWRRVLREAQRVTVPRGYLVLGGNTETEQSARERLRIQWRTFVEETGVSLRPRHGSLGRVIEQLTEWGCYLAMYRLVQWESEARSIDVLDQMRARMFSQSWDVPEETLAAVHERLLPWARAEFGDLEQPLPYKQEFQITVTRWPETLPE